jgi:hypothetical protein
MKRLKVYLRFARRHWPKAYVAYRFVRFVLEALSEATNYRWKRTTNIALS